jgi:hypothetical protein
LEERCEGREKQGGLQGSGEAIRFVKDLKGKLKGRKERKVESEARNQGTQQAATAARGARMCEIGYFYGACV